MWLRFLTTDQAPLLNDPLAHDARVRAVCTCSATKQKGEAMPNPEKILVLVRHAHRDTSCREADNGLSEKGQTQAVRLKSELAAKLANKQPLFVSSPKKRCIETLKPLAKTFRKDVQIDPLLLEEASEEKSSEFIDRIQDFLKWWKTSAPEV